jgi:hypothetical protein
MNLTMKNIVIFFFIIQTASISAQTDKAGFGIHGKIKKLTYYIYNDCQLDSSEIWQEDLCQLNAIKIMYFNVEGNIYQMIDELSTNFIKEKFITEYIHVNNRLKSSRRYRFYTNDLLEELKYGWSGDNLICTFKGKGLTTFTEGTRLVNWRHREVGGSYMTKTHKGQILLQESYRNEIDSTNTLLHTNYKNNDKGDYSIDYSYSQKDEFKNPTMVILRYADTKKIQRYIRKEFEYYD